jgi:hypothetical protein
MEIEKYKGEMSVCDNCEFNIVADVILYLNYKSVYLCSSCARELAKKLIDNL